MSKVISQAKSLLLEKEKHYYRCIDCSHCHHKFDVRDKELLFCDIYSDWHYSGGLTRHASIDKIEECPTDDIIWQKWHPEQSASN